MLWHSSQSNFTARAQATLLHNELESYILKLLSYLPGVNELTLFTPRIKCHVVTKVISQSDGLANVDQMEPSVARDRLSVWVDCQSKI